MADRSTIAVIFDFDDTLVPDSTTALLKSFGMDIERFWQQDARNLVRHGYDPSLAWLRLILQNIGTNKPLGLLRNDTLREFGATLDDKFFRGLPQLFADLRESAAQWRVFTDFYIISGGLREIIVGSEIVASNFRAVYASELDGEEIDGPLRFVKKSVSFTEKTRYLFEISKGITQNQGEENPFAVNTYVASENRPVPFEHMVYVGDGLTDIPCFSLLRAYRGTSFGVFDPTDESKAKRAFLEFLKPDRVVSVHSPNFEKEDDLGSLLRAAVGSLAGKIAVQREQAYRINGGA